MRTIINIVLALIFAVLAYYEEGHFLFSLVTFMATMAYCSECFRESDK